MGVTYEEKRNELKNFLYAFKKELCNGYGILTKGNIVKISDSKRTAFVKVESADFIFENEKEIRIYGPAIVYDGEENMLFRQSFTAVVDITDSDTDVSLTAENIVTDELCDIVTKEATYIFNREKYEF